jgi:hypothetical protein
MNGTPAAAACNMQIIVCSLYSSTSIVPASAARRNIGARPNPSNDVNPMSSRLTQPPPISQSVDMPETIAISSRSRTPARTSSRQNAIGATLSESPPIAMLEPLGTRPAASESSTSLSRLMRPRRWQKYLSPARSLSSTNRLVEGEQ